MGIIFIIFRSKSKQTVKIENHTIVEMILNGQGEYVINGELVVGIAIGALSNPQIKWEQQQSFDIGFDARLFNNQVTIAADYFDRKTNDLLLPPLLPPDIQ